MIAICDYDAGNVMSVRKACAYLGYESVLTRDREQILSADHVILPGVGSFGVAMEKLHEYGLDEVLKETARRGIPLLGICLGLQLMFESSQESPGVSGLGLFEGSIIRIPDQDMSLKIPHMGWNSLTFPSEGKLFSSVPEYLYRSTVILSRTGLMTFFSSLDKFFEARVLSIFFIQY